MCRKWLSVVFCLCLLLVCTVWPSISVKSESNACVVNVVYNTMGGNLIEDGTGIVGMDIDLSATREGYVFDGWFADEACTTPITTYPARESVTLYAGWCPADAQVMNFEVDDNYIPTIYADVDLENSDVQDYYSDSTNMSKTAETYHDIVEDESRGKIISVSVGDRANSSAEISGFRLVDKAKTASGFTLTKGIAYSINFKYKVVALPVSTELRVLEGDIDWSNSSYSNHVDYNGFKITTADVGAGWMIGTINFESSLGGVGVHLALHAADYRQRAGTVVYFDDIVIRSFQMVDFTLSASATLVSGKNHTKDGNYALKIDNSAANGEITKVGRVVYASGVGNKKFKTNTINTATAWLYSEMDTSVILSIFSEPDLTKMDTLTINQMVGSSGTVNLKAGQWTRVQVEFPLPSLGDEEETYVTVAVDAGSNDHGIYMDDVSVGMYKSDSSVMQTYEELESGTHPNAPIFNGKLHGLNGNTVVTNKGYDGSKQSLEISMQGESNDDASRAVLFFDKKDATAVIGDSYIVAFYAMAEEDLEVTFGLGTSGTIDLSDRANQATLHEAEATVKVSLMAGQWQLVSVYVSCLQGSNPKTVYRPYLTLAAWFDGATVDNVKNVYIDNVSFALEHIYACYCDSVCDLCGFTREVAYDAMKPQGNGSGHWYICPMCDMPGSIIEEHSFTDNCDANCDICNYGRFAPHASSSVWNADSVFHWRICTDCGTQFNFDYHDRVLRRYVAPTCTSTGYSGDVFCGECGVLVSTGAVTDMLPHPTTDVITPPTPDEKGYTTHTCTACDAVYTDRYTDYVAPDMPQIVVKASKSLAGKSVTVQVYLKNNPGINYLVLTPIYNPGLLLKQSANGELFDQMVVGSTFSWSVAGLTDVTADGLLCTLTFEVVAGASLGDYLIGFDYGTGWNAADEAVSLSTVDSVVSVCEFLYGDAGGDGAIDGADLLLVKQYMTNYSYTSGTSSVEVNTGADVNGDGITNGKDLLLLKQYMAKYNYTWGFSTVELGPQ